jgi:hypothetical protein
MKGRAHVLRFGGLPSPLHGGGLFFIGAIFSVEAGLLVVRSRSAAFVVVALPLVAAGLAAPTAVWIGAALTAALTFKGLVSLGVLPAFLAYADIPLTWLALGVALTRGAFRRELLILVALATAMVLSVIGNATDPLRGVFYLLLLGEPIALCLALIIDPPEQGQTEWLKRLAITLGVVQLPVGMIEALRFGTGDPVRGTLFGAQAGAHVASGVAVLAGLWLLYGKRRWMIVVGAALFLLPLLADAKQVIFALLCSLILVWGRARARGIIVLGLASVCAYAFLVLVPASAMTHKVFREVESKHTGKVAAAHVVWSNLKRDPVHLAVGVGPAESVSRAAFLTTPLFESEHSPTAAIGLAPAQLPVVADYQAHELSGGGSSFNSGVSSALGVLGDIGVIGAAVYAFVLFAAFRLAGSQTARIGLVMFILLGFAFDWWEQPPFSLYLALILALSIRARAVKEPDSD